MGASAIRDALKRQNPAVFGAISRQTIDEWMDRKGDQPKWKDNVLQRVGFNPQYNSLGPKSILVCTYCTQLKHLLTYTMMYKHRPVILKLFLQSKSIFLHCTMHQPQFQ